MTEIYIFAHVYCKMKKNVLTNYRYFMVRKTFPLTWFLTIEIDCSHTVIKTQQHSNLASCSSIAHTIQQRSIRDITFKQNFKSVLSPNQYFSIVLSPQRTHVEITAFS